MTISPTFGQLLDDAALLSLEHQLHLVSTLGEHHWHASLSGAPQFSFSGDNPLTCTSVHVLGSAAPGPRSWMWGWANPTGFSRQAIELGEYVREFGKQHDISELTSGEIPFDALPGAPDEPLAVASMMTEAAKAITGRWTSYSAPIGGGSRAAFLIEHPGFALPAPDGLSVMHILRRSLSELQLIDHRRAFHAYASARGIAAWHNDTGMRIIGPGLDIEVTFDGEGRVKGIKAALGGDLPASTG